MASEILFGLGGAIVSAAGGAVLLWYNKGGQIQKQTEWQVEQASFAQDKAIFVQNVKKLEADNRSLTEVNAQIQENLQLAEGQTHQLQQAIAILEGSKTNLSADLTKERDRYSLLHQELAHVRQEKDKRQSELQQENSQLIQQKKAITTQFDQAQSNLSALQAQLTTRQQDSDRLQAELSKAQKQLTNVQSQLKTLEQEKEQQFSEQQAKIEKLSQEKEQAAIKLAQAGDREAQLIQQNRAYFESIAQLQTQISIEQENSTQAQAVRAQLEQQFQTQREQFSQDKDQQQAQFQAQIAQLIQEKEQATVKLAEAIAQLAPFQAQQQHLLLLEQENSDLKAQVSALNSALNQKQITTQQQIEALQQQLAARTVDPPIIAPEKIDPEAIASAKSSAKEHEIESASSPAKGATKPGKKEKSGQKQSQVAQKSSKSDLIPAQSETSERSLDLPPIPDFSEISAVAVEPETVSAIDPASLEPSPAPQSQPPEISTETPIETITNSELSAPVVEAIAPETSASKPLDGKKLVILGNLTQLDRDQAKDLIHQAGGSITSSPNAQTDYAIVGKSPGDKLKKVQKLGINRLNEAQLIQLLIESGLSLPAKP